MVLTEEATVVLSVGAAVLVEGVVVLVFMIVVTVSTLFLCNHVWSEVWCNPTGFPNGLPSKSETV